MKEQTKIISIEIKIRAVGREAREKEKRKEKTCSLKKSFTFLWRHRSHDFKINEVTTNSRREEIKCKPNGIKLNIRYEL